MVVRKSLTLKTMSIATEFKEFIMRGNVLELGIAVVIGTAFQGILNSFVNDLIMPLITILGGFKEIEDLKAGPFNYGKIIAAILHFLSVALITFSIIKATNKFKKTESNAS